MDGAREKGEGSILAAWRGAESNNTLIRKYINQETQIPIVNRSRAVVGDAKAVPRGEIGPLRSETSARDSVWLGVGWVAERNREVG